MTKWDHHLRYCLTLIESYGGQPPLSQYLKEQFRLKPQMGSADRRSVRQLVYSFFRLGQAWREQSPEVRVMAGLFCTESSFIAELDFFRPDWNRHIGASLEEKIRLLSAWVRPLDPRSIFPWPESLSQGVDHRAFCLSFLRKPRLFIRIRPGRGGSIRESLQSAGISVEEPEPQALSLPPGLNLEAILKDSSSYEVQDLSSQRTGALLHWNLPSGQGPLRIWDACAGSGGKAIMLLDQEPSISLLVSDKRPSILRNLERRFIRAGLSLERGNLKVLDLESGPIPGWDARGFDGIILDAPCSGSGTWARTPEQLYFFDPGRLPLFSQRQRLMACHVLPFLRPGGTLKYLTCSVFRQENEDLVQALGSEGLIEEDIRLFPGYEQGADTLYGASLKKGP